MVYLHHYWMGKTEYDLHSPFVYTLYIHVVKPLRKRALFAGLYAKDRLLLAQALADFLAEGYEVQLIDEAIVQPQGSCLIVLGNSATAIDRLYYNVELQFFGLTVFLHRPTQSAEIFRLRF